MRASAASLPRALLVDDNPDLVAMLAEFVSREGFHVTSAATLGEARGEIAKSAPDILLIDIHLPDGNSLDALDGLELPLTTEVVLITGQATVETAVLALRRGVADYLTKPVDFARLKMVLANVARALQMKGEIGKLRGELRKLGRFGALIGVSPPMQKVYDLIERVARTDASILIVGETGTGKELVAQTLHSLSRRSKEAFIAVDCGAVSPTLIESELFGHEKGSFTGADRQHKGYFERAHRGTLFLDEVTEMPLELQVRLLRVLETSVVTRVGGQEPIKVDVRLVAATNRVLAEAVAEGKLREDLMYRLNVFPIQLPPLRERGDDVERLAEYFLGELNAAEGSDKPLTAVGRARLRKHDWPGNVREMRNVVQRAFILAEHGMDMDSLSPVAEERSSPSSNLSIPLGTPIASAERLLIQATLDQLKGDKKKAAAALEISLKTLYTRLSEYKTS